MRALLLALAATLLMAAPSQADVTASDIDDPADDTFVLDDESGGNVSVSGMATASNPGTDQVDIICTYLRDGTPDGADATATVTVQNNGTFSADVPLSVLNQQPCRLRAVPAGMTPANFTAFTGPRIGVGERHLHTVPGGWGNYSLTMNSLSGLATLEDPSFCGVEGLGALDPTTLNHVFVFGCGDQLNERDAAASPTRSEVRVDGKDAYFTSPLSNLGATGFPTDPFPALSYDTATGLGSVSSQQTLASCTPGSGFPPSSGNCSGAAPAGVRVDHTGSPLGNGHLITTSDTFVSVDSRSHDLDLLFENESQAGVVTWRFPGQSSFAAHATGDVVSSFPGGPGATLLDQGGQSFGVFTWGAPPSDARFSNAGSFETHYLLHIAPDCPATIRFGWGYAFTQGEVDALTPDALSAVTTAPASCPSSGPSGAAPVPISQHVTSARLGRVKVGGDGTVTVLVNVTDPGSASGTETAVVPRGAKKKRTKKLVVSRARKVASKAGQVKLVLRLNRKGKSILRAKHKLPVTLALTFKPSVGAATKLAPKHLTLKLRRTHKK
jgi:hypothetical protein